MKKLETVQPKLIEENKIKLNTENNEGIINVL